MAISGSYEFLAQDRVIFGRPALAETPCSGWVQTAKPKISAPTRVSER